MALTPIDLQTLFSQIDKVGKQESIQRSGAALAHALQDERIQERTDERIRSVNETQDSGAGAEGINDKNGRRNRRGQDASPRRREEAADKAGEESRLIRDPDLGRNIDFSL